jgi:hypothetical protein
LQNGAHKANPPAFEQANHPIVAVSGKKRPLGREIVSVNDLLA